MWRNKKNWPRKKNSTWSWSRSGILISRRKNSPEYAARYDAQNSIWLLYLLHIIRNESGRLISFIDKPPNNERQHSVVARHLHLGNRPISYKYTGVLANYQVKHITRFDEKSTWDGSASMWSMENIPESVIRFIFSHSRAQIHSNPPKPCRLNGNYFTHAIQLIDNVNESDFWVCSIRRIALLHQTNLNARFYLLFLQTFSE